MDAPAITSKRLLAAALAMKHPQLTHTLMSNLDISERVLATGALLMVQELSKDGFFSQEQAIALGEMIDSGIFKGI